MSLNLNSYELNVLMRALNDHESVLSSEWEKAQKVRPYGARATSLVDELREVRRLADVLHAEHRAVPA
jgi:hypothetical protein